MQFNQLYFYTSTIHQWKPLISDFHFENIILDSLSYLYKTGCIKVYGFVIMPNHIHLIWQLLKNNGKESPAASLMKFTAHQFEKSLKTTQPDMLHMFKVEQTNRRYNFWQTNPDWFLLKYISTIEQKLNYIHCNPLQEKWKLCELPSAYPFSSAEFYASGKNRFDFLHHYSEFVESSLWTYGDKSQG